MLGRVFADQPQPRDKRGRFLPKKPPGNAYWVDGSICSICGIVHGSDSNDGKSFKTPFKTINHALTQCKEEQNDLIIIDHAATQCIKKTPIAPVVLPMPL